MIVRVLGHTPAWVYGLFVALLLLGLQQARDRRVGARRAFALPAAMVVLSLAGVGSSFGLAPVPLAMWALGLVAVTALGCRLLRDDRIAFAPSSRTFFIPGSWIPLLVIMALFFARYAFAVTRALDPGLAESGMLAAALGLAHGCCSGYFASRAVQLASSARRA